MSTEGQHAFDALGKEKTKVLTFTNAVDFYRDSVLFVFSLIESCDAENSGSLKKSVFIEYQ